MFRVRAERRPASARSSAEEKAARPPIKKRGRITWVMAAIVAAGICLLGTVLFALTRQGQHGPPAPTITAKTPGAERSPTAVQAEPKADTSLKIADSSLPPPTHSEKSLGMPSAIVKAPATVDCSQLGTKIVFFKDPPQAFQRARLEDKLVFFLHLSGNFEDDAFT